MRLIKRNNKWVIATPLAHIPVQPWFSEPSNKNLISIEAAAYKVLDDVAQCRKDLGIEDSL